MMRGEAWTRACRCCWAAEWRLERPGGGGRVGFSRMRYQPLPLAEQVTVHGTRVKLDSPPDGLLTLEDAGLLLAPGVHGQVIYRAPGTLFETRATVTPGRDCLMMFPADSADHDPAEGNCHYGRADRKINDLVASALRTAATAGTAPHRLRHRLQPARLRAVHPRAGRRIYAFGTQPIWERYRREQGLRENAPIGYPWSDDDGHTWSDVRLIEPDNDPGYRVGEQQMVGNVLVAAGRLLREVVTPAKQLQDGPNQILLGHRLIRLLVRPEPPIRAAEIPAKVGELRRRGVPSGVLRMPSVRTIPRQPVA